jgi:hypothetical protein
MNDRTQEARLAARFERARGAEDGVDNVFLLAKVLRDLDNRRVAVGEDFVNGLLEQYFLALALGGCECLGGFGGC